MSRIKLTDNPLGSAIKMSDGNPGAMRALSKLLNVGGLIELLKLDDAEIYGADIYVLWNDKCDRDFKKFVALINNCDRVRLQQLAADHCREMMPTEDDYVEND